MLLFALLRFPYVLKPALAALIVAGAGAAYFMNTYGVLIDDDMLRNALQTDAAETAGLLSWTLLVYLLALGLLPAIVLMRVRLRWATPLRSLLQTSGLILIAILLTAASVAVNYKAAAPFVREHGKQMRFSANPLNLVQSSIKLARHSQLLASDTPYHTVADYVRRTPDAAGSPPNLTVLVVGETARAMNFSLNGYHRNTNPELAKLDVVNFNSVASCGTATAISLPCMFSGLGRDHYSSSAVFNRENLLDIAKRAGYRVLWIDNQAGSKEVSNRVETRQLTGPANEWGEVSDASFIDAFERVLDEPAQPTLLVMHQMGSHGPEYYKRSSATTKRFLPECRDKQFDRCTEQEIRNAYDNSIVETDHLLAGLIKAAQRNNPQRPVSILYASDHGESIGENGLYLHGMPYAMAPGEQTHVPMIYWANPAAARFAGVSATCAADQQNRALSHDNYYDSVLGLLRIEADIYNAERDIFSNCRPAPAGPATSPLRQARDDTRSTGQSRSKLVSHSTAAEPS